MAQIRSYTKNLNGKTVEVEAYNAARGQGQEQIQHSQLTLLHSTRPPLVATPGQYPGGRKYPHIFVEHQIPDVEEARPASTKELADAKRKAEEAGMEVTPPPSDDVQAAIAKLRAHGHRVRPVTKPRVKSDGSEIKATFVHPKSGYEIDVPEGGAVWQHRRFKDSYLVLSADSLPVWLVGKNGKAQKPPTHLRLSNFRSDIPVIGRPKKVSADERETRSELAQAILALQEAAR